MNFIDKYKEQLAEMLDQASNEEADGENTDNAMTAEQAEQLLGLLQEHAISINSEEQRERANKEIKELANTCCDVADIFFDRCKGKITNGKTVELIKAFYEIIGGIVA